MKINLHIPILLLLLVIIASCTNSADKAKESSTTNNSNLIAMVMENDLYGYINTNDEFIIKPQYPLARTFSNGLACINKGGDRNNSFVAGAIGGEYFFINTKNEIQLNNFKSFSPMSFYNNVAVIIAKNDSKELLNKDGKIVANGFSTLGNNENNLIPAVKDSEKKLGFIDDTGNWKIELPFKYFIGPFSEGLSAFTDTDTKLSGFFDEEGKIAIPATYKAVSNFNNGLARVKNNATYFFITKENKPAFEKQFEFAGDFSEGLCAVQQMGQWGFMNKQGEIVIDFKDYLGVREFSEGLAAFKQQDGKVGYLNAKGEVQIKPSFDNGLSFKNGFAIIEQNGKMGFINTKGEIVIEPKYTRAGNFVNPDESNKVFKEN